MASSLLQIAFVLQVPMFAAQALAATPPKPAPQSPAQIVCEVNDSDDTTGTDRILARLTITLDGNGVASTVQLTRVLAPGQKADFLADRLDLKFDDRHHLITHAVRPNKVVDHETDGRPIFDWGIPRVEYIEAQTEAGDFVSVAINDHTYAGSPGSTVTYKAGSKTYSSASTATTLCQGRLKFPMRIPSGN